MPFINVTITMILAVCLTVVIFALVIEIYIFVETVTYRLKKRRWQKESKQKRQ